MAPCIEFNAVSRDSRLTQLVAPIRAQQANLPAFKFYKTENDSVELNPLESVASLLDNNGAKVVYVRPVPAAGAYLHELAAIFAFSRLND